MEAHLTTKGGTPHFPEYLVCIQCTNRRASQHLFFKRHVAEPICSLRVECGDEVWFLRDRSSWWFRWTGCCVTSCGNSFAAARSLLLPPAEKNLPAATAQDRIFLPAS